MRTSTRLPLLLAFSAAFTLPVAGQSSQAPAPAPARQDQITTIRTQAKLVIVDVVVTDKNHRPAHGLTKDSFTVTEGGKPQTINSFQEHKGLTATEAAKFEAIPKLPPGVFTNYTPTPINSAVNILLLDTLNTPLQDQQFVRQQLMKYLNSAHPGTSVAVFGLSTRLVMLQGFTSNPEVLKAVVNKQMGKGSVLLDDVVGGGGMAMTADDENQAMGGLLPADVVANMQTVMDIQTSFQLTLRAKYTLDAMNVLARYLAAIPGRKNLLWFSGSFPLDIMPDTENGASDPFAAVADSEQEYRETTNLLARSQVAVYPIDARGLMVSPVMSAASSGSQYARNPGAMGRDLRKFSTDNANEHFTMQRMADDTGGKAYYNTNGLTEAVEKAIDDGSNYYTLTYSPTDNRWKGDYRKIDIKLSQPGYQLAYRHGYYADDPNSVTSPVSNAAAPNLASGVAEPARDPGLIMKAMAHGVPSSSQILYKVRILPTSAGTEDTLAPGNGAPTTGPNVPKPPFRRFSIDYTALPADLTFGVTPDGVRHLRMEFIALVYNPDGVLINHTSRAITANLTPEGLAQIRHTGFPFHQEISVPVKGEYSIRVGVHDLVSNKIGCSEVGLAGLMKLPPVSSLEPAAAPPAPAAAPAAPPKSEPAPAPQKN